MVADVTYVEGPQMEPFVKITVLATHKKCK